MSVRRWINGNCVELNTQADQPGDPCNANRNPARSSIPVVCSTLPWAAIQQVNQGKFVGLSARDWGRRYSIQLDTGPNELTCPQLVKGDPRARVVDSGTADGLVVFDAAQRTAAANWFHDALAAKVRDQLAGRSARLADRGVDRRRACARRACLWHVGAARGGRDRRG